MILGYNTNGFAHHRLTDAIEILADLGYQGIALTPDVNHLDPNSALFWQEANLLAEQLRRRNLSCVVETGARFVLDARRKHDPTLLSPEKDRVRRREFLKLCTRLAALLGSNVVSFWSGAATTNEPTPILMTRLADECRQLADFACNQNVRIGFEPEPGMFIDTMDRFSQLHSLVNHPAFGLTLDVGHLVCLNEFPIRQHIRRWSDWLWNVHLDDMKPDVHDHLKFGEGVLDFAEVFSALQEIGFRGIASVELSRHSHDAVRTAEVSMSFLRKQLDAIS